MNMSYLSCWRQVEEGMQRDPAQQNHEGQRVPQMVGVGEGRGPLEHTGLRASTHRYQEQHRQRKKDGDAYGTWETITDNSECLDNMADFTQKQPEHCKMYVNWEK